MALALTKWPRLALRALSPPSLECRALSPPRAAPRAPVGCRGCTAAGAAVGLQGLQGLQGCRAARAAGPPPHSAVRVVVWHRPPRRSVRRSIMAAPGASSRRWASTPRASALIPSCGRCRPVPVYPPCGPPSRSYPPPAGAAGGDPRGGGRHGDGGRQARRREEGRLHGRVQGAVRCHGPTAARVGAPTETCVLTGRRVKTTRAVACTFGFGTAPCTLLTHLLLQKLCPAMFRFRCPGPGSPVFP